MIKTKKTIKNLFLIRNETEYISIIELAKQYNLTDFEILTIKDEPPYLVNDCADFEKVSTWQKFGLPDPGLSSRFWSREYKTIDEIISAEMANDEKYNNEIIKSSHFKFDLVWLFGRQYYDVINTLNDFLQKHKPQATYFKPENNFICNLILSFARVYNIKCRKLNL